MKDYVKIGQKIQKLGNFSEISQCGYPSQYFPVNLFCRISEAYIIGYSFYVSYNGATWSIDYSLTPCVEVRTDMEHIRGIKTEKEMLREVDELLWKIREQCGIRKP